MVFIMLCFALTSCHSINGDATKQQLIQAEQVRFPGWTSYTDPNEITDLAIDRKGNFWGVGSGGAIKWHPNGNYTLFHIENGLLDHAVTCIAVHPDGSIWFGSYSGITKYDGENWTYYKTDRGVKAIAITSEGIAWVGTTKGLLSFDGINWQSYSSLDGLAGYAVEDITITADGKIWVIFAQTWVEGRMTGPGGVSVFDGKAWKPYWSNINFPLRGGGHFLAAGADGKIWAGCYFVGCDRVAFWDGQKWNEEKIVSEINNMAISPDGSIWYGDDQKVTRISPDGRIQVFGKEDGIDFGYITTLLVDEKEVLYVGSMNGIFRFDGKNWQSYTAPGMRRTAIDIAFQPDGTVWLGHFDQGISRFDGEQWTNFTTENGLPSNHIYTIAIGPDSTVWIGTKKGIARFLNETWEIVPLPEIENGWSVDSILFASNGDIWVGALQGLLRANPEKAEPFQVIEVETGAYNFDVLFEDSKNRIWAGTFSKGLFHWDGRNWSAFNTQNGFPDSAVYGIGETKDGMIWVRTGWGVMQYDRNRWEDLSCPEKNPCSGQLPVYGGEMAQTPNGHWWFVSSQQIFYYDGVLLKEFTDEDLLLPGYPATITVAPDGSIWFGTYDGASRLDLAYIADYTK